MNPYEVLGIGRKSSQPIIKAAYRKLSKKYHPDKAGDDPEILSKFHEIQEAYEILSDPLKKARFDETGNTDSPYSTTEHEIEQTIIRLFSSVMDSGPGPVNYIEEMVKILKTSRRQLKTDIQHSRDRLVKLLRLQRGVKKSGDGNNVIQDYLNQQVEGTRQQIKAKENALDISVETEKRLKDYSFEVDPQSEGHFNRGPTARLSGPRFPTPA